ASESRSAWRSLARMIRQRANRHSHAREARRHEAKQGSLAGRSAVSKTKHHPPSPRAPMVTPDGGIPRRNPTPNEAQHLARILEVVPGGIIQVDADGAILRANGQAQRFLGLSWASLSRR